MKPPINWYGNLSYGQGYSGSSLLMAKYLDRDLRDVRAISFVDEMGGTRDERFVDAEMQKILAKPFQLAKIGIAYGFPNTFSSIMNKVKIGFTMFETDTLPSGGEKNDWAGNGGDAIKHVNRLDALFVPCQHNKELFEKSGATIPIFVVPLGVDTDEKPLYQIRGKRKPRKTFKFLFCGTYNTRKGMDLVIRAFSELFRNRDDVQLVLKVNKQSLKWNFKEINVKMIEGYKTQEELHRIYYNADCFIFPSRGEGFGLTPLEAMYQGVPTIVSDNTGMSEYAQSGYCLPIPVTGKSKAHGFPKEWGSIGSWYEPEYEALRDAMLDVFVNRNAYNQMGMSASQWVKNNWSYKNTAEKIDAILKENFEK